MYAIWEVYFAGDSWDGAPVIPSSTTSRRLMRSNPKTALQIYRKYNLDNSFYTLYSCMIRDFDDIIDDIESTEEAYWFEEIIQSLYIFRNHVCLKTQAKLIKLLIEYGKHEAMSEFIKNGDSEIVRYILLFDDEIKCFAMNKIYEELKMYKCKCKEDVLLFLEMGFNATVVVLMCKSDVLRFLGDSLRKRIKRNEIEEIRKVVSSKVFWEMFGEL
jgi:hypothetical protein